VLTLPRVRARIPPPRRDRAQVPRYDCLFKTAAERATTELIMYSNSDMVYFPDLLAAMDKVASEHYDFLMVGQRIDILYPRVLQFDDPNWAADFQRHVAVYGKPHGKFGIDYFLYRTALTRDMPPFIVGRVRWDNWLLAQFIGNQDAVAVDSTRVVMAVHLNHMKVGGSHERVGTDYNINLTKADMVDPKKIGDIEMCDFVLAPVEDQTPPRRHGDEVQLPVGCPNCKLVRTEQSLDVMLYKHSKDGNIIIATITSGYIDFAFNWLCSLRRVNIRNFLFHAADEDLYRRLLGMGVPVIYYESEQAREFRLAHNAGSSAVDYGSVAYQALMNTRTEFIYKILQKGYNVLLCDVDIIFLRDPFPFFDMSLDIQGGAHKKTKVTGGYVFFRATPAARTVWVKVLLQHRDMFKQLQSMSEFNPHSMTEQELLNQMLIESKNTDLKWGVVDERVIADGKRFFIDKLTQKNGEWPAAIHNNYIVGADNKRERFQNISMWMVKPDLTCRPFPRYLPPMPTGQPQFIFKIIAFNRPASLQRLLDSLLASDYQGDTVPLEFYIDAPDDAQAQDEALLRDHARVVQMAQDFQWPHGPKRVVVRETHFGLVNMWLNSWFPTSDNEFALFLEDDNIVVTGFYEFMKAAVLHYQFDPENYDGRVFGFNMQHQHMIPGRYPKKPSEFLDKGTLFYKYQLLSTWGPVFFPAHWSEFITWFAEMSADEKFLPLFSNMITNDWFMKVRAADRGGRRAKTCPARSQPSATCTLLGWDRLTTARRRPLGVVGVVHALRGGARPVRHLHQLPERAVVHRQLPRQGREL